MAFANEGAVDRALRIVLGLGLFYVGLGGVATGMMATVAVIVGVIALGTGLIGWCPLYWVLGFGTR